PNPLWPDSQPPADVTFGQFAALLRKRHHRPDGEIIDELVAANHKRIADTREFFTRVFQGRYADTVIVYDSVLTRYQREAGYLVTADPTARTCACGCGRPVFDRKKWSTSACRQRAHRNRVTDVQVLAA